jgi:hypothetical protein
MVVNKQHQQHLQHVFPLSKNTQQNTLCFESKLLPLQVRFGIMLSIIMTMGKVLVNAAGITQD